MTWMVVVPLIEEPIRTHDARKAHDICPHDLMYVDNTHDGAYRSYEKVCTYRNGTGENWGVARSWNEGLSADRDWTLILSSSVVLPNGLQHALGQFEEVIEAGERHVVFTDEGLHAFALSRETVRRVGLFDENFRPGYYEDNDWLWRLHRAGVKEPPWSPKIDLAAGSYTDACIARALKRGLVKVDFGELRAYYVRKWGGLPGEEKFETPFDSGEWVGWWEER